MARPGVDDPPVTAGTIEVHGQVVRALWRATDSLDAARRRTVREALSARTLDEPDEDDWYPFGPLRTALAELCETAGEDAVAELGRNVSPALETSDAASVADGLAGLDDVLAATHRGDDVGSNEFRQIGDTDGRMECRTAYPCPFKRGVILGIMDDLGDGYARLNEVGTCRDDGGDRCTFELSW